MIVKGTRTARIWSRQGVDLTAGFPEVAEAAVARLPPGSVLDGELVILGDDGLRTDFGLLGRRLHTSPRRIAIERKVHPASWVGFDLLAVAGTDVRPQPLRTRLQLLQKLADEFAPPLQLCPTTTDHATAVRWMTEWAPTGIEGVVAKGLASPYIPGSRAHWVKVKSRSTTELIVGGLTGTWDRPTGLVGGRFDAAGRLRIVARSTRLSEAAASAVRAAVSPSRADHPWPEIVAAATFSAARTRLLPIEPVVVAEVVTDTACDRGVWRHPVRFVVGVAAGHSDVWRDQALELGGTGAESDSLSWDLYPWRGQCPDGHPFLSVDPPGPDGFMCQEEAHDEPVQLTWTKRNIASRAFDPGVMKMAETYPEPVSAPAFSVGETVYVIPFGSKAYDNAPLTVVRIGERSYETRHAETGEELSVAFEGVAATPST